MSEIWFISDTHFGHDNILTFKNYDGSQLRSFSCIEEHDEHIVSQWNKVIRPADKVYHLGDIAMNKKALPILNRLVGHKRLVRGNHDAENTDIYLPYFEEIYGVRVFSGPKRFICSHIPIHPDCLSKWPINVHGHLHGNRIMENPHKIDRRYYSVCCEQVAYTPVNITEIHKYIEDMI